MHIINKGFITIDKSFLFHYEVLFLCVMSSRENGSQEIKKENFLFKAQHLQEKST